MHNQITFAALRQHVASSLASARNRSCEELPRQISLRFRHNPELSFPTGDFAGLEEDCAGQCTVTANFLGLSGAGAPLPDYLLHALARDDASCNRARDYLDRFHHRLYELFFLGLAEQDLAQALCGQDEHVWKTRLCDLLGIESTRWSHALSLRDLSALAPALLQANPGPESLVHTLRSFLAPQLGDAEANRARLELESYCGGACTLDPVYQHQLGRRNHALAGNCILGKEVKNPSAKICVQIHELSKAQLESFEQGIAKTRLDLALALLVPPPTIVEVLLHAKDARSGAPRLGHSRLAARRSSPAANSPDR